MYSSIIYLISPIPPDSCPENGKISMRTRGEKLEKIKTAPPGSRLEVQTVTPAFKVRMRSQILDP